MCIRDSLDRPLEERQDGGLGIFLALWGVDDFAYERQGEICLLYTSDAADERSSVDLGGRRIIKKKNIIDHERMSGHRHTHDTDHNT